jgi:hypothetical protein
MFDPERIGRGKYKAGVAAVSRALGRLVDRGLLTVTKEAGRYPVRKRSRGSWRRYGYRRGDIIFECPVVEEQLYVTHFIRLTDEGIRVARSLPVYRLASQNNPSKKLTISLQDCERNIGGNCGPIG